MYVCSSCGAEFEQPRYIPWSKGGLESPEYVCPDCGQTWDGEPAKLCNLCGEYYHPNDMASEHCCKACARDRLTPPIMKRYIADTEQRGEFYVEFMLDSVVEYAGDVLKDLAEKHFDSLPEGDKLKYLIDYIGEYYGDFAAWLEDEDNV